MLCLSTSDAKPIFVNLVTMHGIKPYSYDVSRRYWGGKCSKLFPPASRDVVGRFRPRSETIVPRKAALSFFYTFKSLSMIPASKYSIIQAKLFVNSQKIKLFVNKSEILCNVVLSIVIPCELVSNRIFVMHTLPLLSMVEINGKPPLTGAGECAFRLSSGVSHKRADAASKYF